MNPKTPPSTPFLEKGPSSNSKRTKPIYGAGHRYPAQFSSPLYTRFLHAVILVLLCTLTALYRLHFHPHNAFPLPWSPAISTSSANDADTHDRDIAAQLRTCRLSLSPDEILCIENSNGILAPADPTNLAQAYGGLFSSSLDSLSAAAGAGGEGGKEKERGREAWLDMQRGLEGLWARLVESRCKCENAEALDRAYEGLRERAGTRAMGKG
ncbi:hypothetical protein N7G274_000743 [Stereocaulon virgatum]|uniref:Uncharacterized protein n=1 Tax=Stereocaulon virgatum TaxID=373712 RepID=A0ABR4ASE5_9LECA